MNVVESRNCSVLTANVTGSVSVSHTRQDRGVEADHVRVRDRFDTQPVLGEPERHCVREVRQQARDGEEVGGLDVGVETREGARTAAASEWCFMPWRLRRVVLEPV